MEMSIKIIAWNANGLQERKNELHYFLSFLALSNIDAVFISETHFTQHQIFHIPAYVINRTDRPARVQGLNSGSGIAIFVNHRLVHYVSATATGKLPTGLSFTRVAE